MSTEESLSPGSHCVSHIKIFYVAIFTLPIVSPFLSNMILWSSRDPFFRIPLQCSLFIFRPDSHELKIFFELVKNEFSCRKGNSRLRNLSTSSMRIRTLCSMRFLIRYALFAMPYYWNNAVTHHDQQMSMLADIQPSRIMEVCFRGSVECMSWDMFRFPF